MMFDDRAPPCCGLSGGREGSYLYRCTTTVVAISYHVDLILGEGSVMYSKCESPQTLYPLEFGDSNAAMS